MGSERANDSLRKRLQDALAEQYAVEEEIGRGGMGIVYRATDRRLRRTVALKLLPPELAFRDEVRSRFLREAISAAQLSHPNIVPIYSVDEREGLVYFAMGFVDGENLGHLIKRQGRVAVAKSKQILTEVASALAYAHERGVVHRDIKPDNIIIDATTGQALVTDFGIARAMSGVGETRLTATGVAIGTPAYMSPEQCAGETETDGRSDLYSLGVVAFEMLSGRAPFIAPTTPAMLMKHFSEVPPDLHTLNPGIPPGLAIIVMRLLEKRPSDRYASGKELVAELSRDDAAVQVKRGKDASVQPARVQNPGTAAADSSSQPQTVYRAPAEESIERKGGSRKKKTKFRDRPLGERVRIVRGESLGVIGWTLFFFLINLFTSFGFPWFIFPSLAMGIEVWTKFASLLAEGLRWDDIFGANAKRIMAGESPASPRPMRGKQEQLPVVTDEAEKYAPREILSGAHGETVRQAVADYNSLNAQIGKLAQRDLELVPDVGHTARDLLDRVVKLAGTLASLDSDVDIGKIRILDDRIAAEMEGGGASERKMALLRKQRTSLQQLADSRAEMHSQLEGAALMLQNLALDVIKLRSAGMQGMVSEVNSATREARALIKEIGYAVDAADELRAIDQQSKGERR